jgi:cytochrome P450
MLHLIFTVVVALLIIQLIWSLRHRYALPVHIPGSMGLPLIGETIQFALDIRGFAVKRHAKYGPVFKTHLLGFPSVFVAKEEDMKKALLGGNNVVSFTLPSSFQDMVHGSPLTIESCDRQKAQRVTLLKCLTGKGISDLMTVIQSVIEGVADNWKYDESFDMHQHIRNVAFRLIQSTIMGEFDIKFHDQIHGLYETFQLGFASLPIKLPMTTFGKALQARKNLEVLMLEQIQRRIDDDNDGEGILGALLASRRKEENDITNAELSVQMVILLFVGYDTTTSTMNRIVAALATRPELANKLYEEARELPAKLEMLPVKALPLIDAVLKEAMRMNQTVPSVFRQTVSSYETSTGMVVPAKWSLYMGISASSQLYSGLPDADEFKPERWISEPTAVAPSRFSYVPFGAGGRSCVGMELARIEIKVFIITLLRRATFKSDNVLVWKDLPVAYPVNGHLLTLTKRNIYDDLATKSIE